MRKFISAVTSLAMAATMAASVVPATSVAADATKGFAIKTYAESDSPYASMGSTVEVKASDVAAGDVTIPCAVYLDEQTADAQGMQFQLTVNGGAGAGDIVFKSYEPSDSYFSTAKEFTVGGETFSSKQPVYFSGTYDPDLEEYVNAGMYQSVCVKGSKSANTPNYFYSISWTQPTDGYKYEDSKSTDHPFAIFDVTLPKGIAEGTYTIDFLTYNTSDKEGVFNPATMIETRGRYTEQDGTLKLENMTIKVGDGTDPQPQTTQASAQTTTTPAPVQTTTTKANVTPGDGIVLDFGNYEVEVGKEDVELKVDIALNSNGLPIIGGDFKIDTPFEITKITEKCPALGGCAVVISPEDKQFNFGCPDSNQQAMKADDSKKFVILTLKIPAGTASGTYNVGLGDKAEVVYNNKGDGYKVSGINGEIVVKGSGDPQTTQAPAQTTTTKAPVQTTTTKTNVTPGDGIVLDFGNYEVEVGKEDVELKVDIALNSNGLPIIGGDFKIDTPFEITKITEKCPALGGCAVVISPEDKQFNFGCPDSNQQAMKADDSKKFVILTLKIPAGTASGTYNVGLGDKAEVVYNNKGDGYKVSGINGEIVVKGSGDPQTTTTKAPAQTTTTSTTTKTPVQTTTTTNTNPEKLVPDWGDSNCDGTVNVADVVVLNKWLNENSSYNLTDQGKVNADCCDPQDASGAAVDPAKVDLTAADSNAIIRSIVSLVTLPTNS